MLNKNSRPKPVSAANTLVRPAQRLLGWRLTLGVLLSVGILLFAFFNRAWILEALGLARAAKPVAANGRPPASRRLPGGRRGRRGNRGAASRAAATTVTAGWHGDMSARIDDRSSGRIGE